MDTPGNDTHVIFGGEHIDHDTLGEVSIDIRPVNTTWEVEKHSGHLHARGGSSLLILPDRLGPALHATNYRGNGRSAGCPIVNGPTGARDTTLKSLVKLGDPTPP